jgi:hypothetical protein
MDLSNVTDTQKTAIAHGVAYGIHHSACNSVSSMWATLDDCFSGTGLNDTSFGMEMNVDTQLVSTQPTVSDYTTTANSTRRLTAVTLSNAGAFSVSAPTPALVAAASTSLETAIASGSLSASSVKAALTSALQARESVIGAAVLNATLNAVASATVNTTVPTTEIILPTTAAPASSGASATGVSTVLVAVLALVGATYVLA